MLILQAFAQGDCSIVILLIAYASGIQGLKTIKIKKSIATIIISTIAILMIFFL